MIYHREKGFTLIELLVAISIIAVLSAILLPNFMGVREKAKDSQKIQDLSAVKNALRMYYNDNNSYPDTADPNVVKTALANYMKDVGSVDIDSYTVDATADTFTMTVRLTGKVGDEWKSSLVKCRYNGYDSIDDVNTAYAALDYGEFAVCAN